MAKETGPNLGLVAHFGSGASGWDGDMDANLDMLDALVAPAVLSVTLTAPPSSPAAGDRYIVAAAATGAWVGKSNSLAVYRDGAWVFYTPKIGLRVFDIADSAFHYFGAAGWALEPAAAASGGGSSTATGKKVNTNPSKTDFIAVSPLDGDQVIIYQAGSPGRVFFQNPLEANGGDNNSPLAVGAEVLIVQRDAYPIYVGASAGDGVHIVAENLIDGGVVNPGLFTVNGPVTARAVYLGQSNNGSNWLVSAKFSA